MTPPDQAARDRIVSSLDRTLFVEAGAGAGKTTSLVGRLLALVRDGGIDLGRIAAITFTRKAASDLRAKVRAELTRTADDPRSEAALEAIDTAAIETIHGFAQRLLSQRPMEASLAPGFRVQDEAATSLRFGRWWRAAYREMLLDPALTEHWRAAFAAGLTEANLRSLADQWTDNWDRIVHAPALAAYPEGPLDELANALAEAREARSWCKDPEDNLAVILDRWISFEDALGPKPWQAARVLDAWPRTKTAPGRAGKAAAWGRRKDEAAQIAKALHQHPSRALLRGAVCRPVFEELRERIVQEAAARAARGELQYHDLLVRARDLLRDRPKVRDELRERFRRILVDEFQDTDPLQVEIVQLLGGEPGRVFVVGDPKQSIYRFRRADVHAFAEARHTLGGEPERLTANFRSRPEIVAWIDATFAKAFAGSDQVAFAPMEAQSPPGPGERVLRLTGTEGGRAAELREREAEAIARAVLTIVREGWPVRDGAAERPARLSDIAVLLPARQSQEALEDAFAAAAVPVRVESRSRVWGTPEVRGLIELLRAGIDPSDDVAQAAAMRHPAFGLTDEEIVRWRQTGEGAAVARAVERLLKVGKASLTRPLAGWVDLGIRELGLLELAVADRRPSDAWSRYRFFKESARSFSESVGPDPLAFLDWAAEQREERALVEEALVISPDDDAVRLSTIHAAKGLEYPVVIFAGVGAWFRGSRSESCVFARDGGLAIRMNRSTGEIATQGAAAAHEAELEEENLEAMRLLYVGATRARDYLVLGPLEGAKGVSRLFSECAAPCQAWSPVEGEPLAAPARPGATPAPDLRAEAQEALGSGAASAKAVAATALRRLLTGEPPDEDPLETAEPFEPSPLGPLGAAVGRAVHAVLARIDLADGAGAERAAQGAAIAEGVPERAAEVLAAVRNALASAAVARAREGRVWREAFVSGLVEGWLIEGYADLVIETPEGLWVVDYKTDSGDSARRDERMAAYRTQGAAYALALEAATGRPVAGCTFLFVSGPSADERPVEDLAAERERARAALRGL